MPCLQICPYFLTPHAEQRANTAPLHRPDPGKTGKAASTQKMMQDCFGIVIPVMSQGNFDPAARR